MTVIGLITIPDPEKLLKKYPTSISLDELRTAVNLFTRNQIVASHGANSEYVTETTRNQHPGHHDGHEIVYEAATLPGFSGGLLRSGGCNIGLHSAVIEDSDLQTFSPQTINSLTAFHTLDNLFWIWENVVPHIQFAERALQWSALYQPVSPPEI